MKRGGFTLTEILVSVVIVLALLSGALIVITRAGRDAWLSTEAQLEAQTEAQRIVDRVTEDLLEARSVTCTATTLTISPGPGSIMYAFAPGIGVGAPGTLTRQVGAAAPQVMSTRLTLFIPTPCAAGVVTLQVMAQSRAMIDRPYTQRLRTRIWLQLFGV